MRPSYKQRQRELFDIQKITRVEETFWRLKWTKQLPHGTQEVSFEGTERGRRRQDFKLTGLLGNGIYGRVPLAKKKSTGGRSSSEEVFALKFVSKECVSKVEKEVLPRAVGHPFLVQLLAYFQTKELLCCVMEYMEGGSLRFHFCRHMRFSEDLSRFYAAEIILAVNFLHKCGTVHSDIKPENILLDRNGHGKPADFGLCEVGMFTGSKTSDMCGTKQYMASEIRRGDPNGHEVAGGLLDA